MTKTLFTLLSICIPISLVQLLYNISVYLQAGEERGHNYYGNDDHLLTRMLVYWFGGAVIIILALLGQRFLKMTMLPFLIGGGYLLLLASNGGLWTESMLGTRTILVSTNIVFFSYALIKLQLSGKKT